MKPLFFYNIGKGGLAMPSRSGSGRYINKRAIDYGGFIMVLKMQLKTCSNIAQSPDGL